LQINLKTQKYQLTLEKHYQKAITSPVPADPASNKAWGHGALKGDLDTLSLDPGVVTKLEDVAPCLQKTMGQKVKLGVTTKEFKGKTYNNVYINDWYNAANAAPGVLGDAPTVDSSDEVPF
jgi:hypothetical protein